MTDSCDVVVLGAGPAGIAAAYRLAGAGRDVLVLERSGTVGGLAASFEVAGVRVDHGSHRLHPSCDPEILAVLRGLLGDELQLRERHGRMRLGDRWIAFPPRASDLARNLPWGFALGLARDALGAPWRRPARADTFAEVTRARLGTTMARRFYAPYVEKLFGSGADELAGELARRRVNAASTGALVARLTGRSRAGRGTFWYPQRGFGRIVEVLADAATAAGARFRLGAEVVGLDGSRVRLADGTVVQAGAVASTLPLPVLAELADAPAEVRAAAAELRYRALALVYLGVDRPRWTEYDAHYFPGLEVAVSRVSEPRNYRAGAATDPRERTVLCAEWPCDVGDAVWRASDADLGVSVAASLGVDRVGEVVVRRVPHAYPVYRIGFEEAFAALDAWASAAPGVLTFGRQGLFAHDNTHHALAMGWSAAGTFLDRDSWSVDLWSADSWRAARARFSTHVVED